MLTFHCWDEITWSSFQTGCCVVSAAFENCLASIIPILNGRTVWNLRVPGTTVDSHDLSWRPLFLIASVWFAFLPLVIRTCETCINCDSWRPDRTMTQIKYELARMQCWCKMGLSATNQCIDIFFYWYSWNVSKMKLTPRGEHSYLYNIHFSRNNLCPAFRDIQC